MENAGRTTVYALCKFRILVGFRDFLRHGELTQCMEGSIADAKSVGSKI